MKISRLLTKFLVFVITLYQNTLRYAFPPSCRFHPSCSDYSLEALRKHGLVKGGWLGFKRILRCNPFNAGGYDPVE